MSYVVEPQYHWLTAQIRRHTWERIKMKAQWEHMTLSAVIHNYPDFLPKRLQARAALCFTEDREEMLTRRIAGLKRELRMAEKSLTKLQRLAASPRRPGANE